MIMYRHSETTQDFKVLTSLACIGQEGIPIHQNQNSHKHVDFLIEPQKPTPGHTSKQNCSHQTRQNNIFSRLSWSEDVSPCWKVG